MTRKWLVEVVLAVILVVGLIPAEVIAQDATPGPTPGNLGQSQTRVAFDAELRAMFELEEPSQQGGQLIYGSMSDIGTLNGMLAADVYTLTVTNLVFEPLVTT